MHGIAGHLRALASIVSGQTEEQADVTDIIWNGPFTDRKYSDNLFGNTS